MSFFIKKEDVFNVVVTYLDRFIAKELDLSGQGLLCGATVLFKRVFNKVSNDESMLKYLRFTDILTESNLVDMEIVKDTLFAMVKGSGGKYPVLKGFYYLESKDVEDLYEIAKEYQFDVNSDVSIENIIKE